MRTSILIGIIATLTACGTGDPGLITTTTGSTTTTTGASMITETGTTGTSTTTATVQRKVLHEVFTGSTCGPCLEAEANLEAVLDQNPGQYTVVKYHVGSDPYISHEGVYRRMYYVPGKSSYSIPYVHADGVNGFHPNSKNDVGYTDADFDRYAALPAKVDLSVTHTIKGQTVSWEINYAPLVDISSDDMVVHIAIMEGTTYNNVGTNGQTEFHQVMKKMVPDNNGDALIAPNDTATFSGSYTFEGDYAKDAGYGNEVNHDIEHTVEEFEDLHVITWVQDAVTWEVYQSAWTIEE